jgi:hypothetical protein
VHLFGCIIKKFVTMHGHMNIKNTVYYLVEVIVKKIRYTKVLFPAKTCG